MGLVDKYQKYKANRELKRIAKATKLVKNAKAIKEDRWGALEYLSELKDADKAVVPLLQRFEYSLEHGINDTREKELAFEGIVECGPNAIDYIKTHLQNTTKIAWPIKVLVKLCQEQEVAEVLRSALNFDDVAFDQLAVDKNYDILCYLREYDVAEFASRLQHFLKDPDERVRFAAVEVLIEQTHQEIPQYLEPYLADNTPENRRIKQSVVDAFLKNKWLVTNKELFADSEVSAGGLYLNSAGKLSQR